MKQIIMSLLILVLFAVPALSTEVSFFTDEHGVSSFSIVEGLEESAAVHEIETNLELSGFARYIPGKSRDYYITQFVEGYRQFNGENSIQIKNVTPDLVKMETIGKYQQISMIGSGALSVYQIISVNKENKKTSNGSRIRVSGQFVSCSVPAYQVKIFRNEDYRCSFLVKQ